MQEIYDETDHTEKQNPGKSTAQVSRGPRDSEAKTHAAGFNERLQRGSSYNRQRSQRSRSVSSDGGSGGSEAPNEKEQLVKR